MNKYSIGDIDYTVLPIEQRIVRVTIPNRDYDKRCKHGFRAYPNIPVGMRLTVHREECELHGKPESRHTSKQEIRLTRGVVAAYIYNAKKETNEPNPFYEELLRASERVSDVTALFATSQATHMDAEEFAKLAVELKLLTAEQVETILKHL